MLNRPWCNNGKCSECESLCHLDEEIPCSPDCENLTSTGKRIISKCIEAGCDAIISE